ncbi:MAG: hypothetical protein COA99_13705 [Moraxellaceae bacterium]|nr:MAG: hypothetical protein COA99_13705 [Moraxellaceae bacterium]
MKIIFAFITIALFNTALFAQTDTTSNSQNVNIEVYDVVAVYRDHIDGRGRTRKFTSEIKGHIIKYDESTGVLTFKGIDGRMYSYTSDQYEYFQYDKEFTSKRKKKKQKALNLRKDSGFEISIGLSAGVLNIPTGFETDDNYIGGLTSAFEKLVCLKGGVSKYLNINSSVGLTAEYSMLSSEMTYFNVGAGYQYLYNPTKNAAFYFPLALKFSHYQADHSYQFDETVYTNNGSYWPNDLDANVTINALELNIGQGVSFALKNKRSISLELMLLNQFILSQKVEIPNDVSPITDYRVNGIKLSVLMNF